MQILKLDHLLSVWDSFDNSRPKTIDLETNAQEVWVPTSRIIAASFAGIDKASGTWKGYQIPISHREGTNCDSDVIPTLVNLLSESRLIPFYVQMEASWLLLKYGIRPNWVGDGFIIARIAQQLKEFGLKDLTEKHLGRKSIRYEDVCKDPSKDFSTVHAQDPVGIQHTIDDAVNAGQLEAVLKQKYITPHGMQGIYEIEVQTAALMAEHTAEGYAVDLKLLDKETKNEENQVKQLQNEIFQLLEVKPFSINSGVQLGKALYTAFGLNSTRKTDKGADSWSQDVIQDLIYQTASQHLDKATLCLKKIVDWKSRFSTLASLRRRPNDVGPDGKIHPVWKTIGADGTSRIYGENPSPTSLPKAARRAFQAPFGKRWVKFDWKQAELRILAHLSGDTSLKEALTTGDFHRTVWARMRGIPVEKVTAEEREFSKVISYSILYSGGDSYHVAVTLGVSESRAASHVREYFQLFPKLESYLRGVRSQAISTHHVKTFMNRLRRLDGSDRRKLQNQACNSMGQQSCGTLLKIALVKLQSLHLFNHRLMAGFSQVIPVFDAIYYCIDYSVPLKDHLEFIREYVEIKLGDVTMEAEFETGNTWGELTPVKLEELCQPAEGIH